MQIEKIKLGEGISISAKLMQVMNVASGEELTVLYSEAGMMIMKPLSNLDFMPRCSEWRKRIDHELREKGDLE